MKLHDLKPGDVVMPGNPFWGCLGHRTKRTIQVDDAGDMFIRCADGRHYLDGQTDPDGTLVGLDTVPPRPNLT